MISDVYDKTNIQVRTEVFEIDGKRVLVIQIPSRIHGDACHFEGAYLTRCGEALVPMSAERLREIFIESRTWEDEIILAGVSVQKVCELLDAEKPFELENLPVPSSQTEQLEKLCRLRLLRKNGSSYDILNSGAVLLARRLIDFPTLERKAPRLIVYNGKNKLDTKLDTFGQKGYAVGFQGLVRECMGQIPQNEIVEDALRRHVPLFPEVAVREIIANMLIHQDFTITGTGPTIEIFPNRLEFSNPGNPIVHVNRFIDSHRSRNENIAWAMRQMRICEEKSSGVDRIVETAEIYQLPAPDFIDGEDATHVVIKGHITFSKMNSNDKIRACFQHCVLRWVLRDHMNNSSLMTRFGLSEKDKSAVSRIIKATVDAGLICPDPAIGSSRKHARYVPAWTIGD